MPRATCWGVACRGQYSGDQHAGGSMGQKADFVFVELFLVERGSRQRRVQAKP